MTVPGVVDIARPDLLEKKKKRRIAWGAAAAVAILLLTVGVSRLRPAAPTVERATVVIDKVERGEMVREVRGLGTLVPEEIRWIPAVTDARVERLVLLPGTKVTPDSVILELSNPELEMQALEAESQARAAEARYTELKVRLESQNLDQRAAAARVEAEAKQARLQADADAELAKNGLIAGLTLKLSQSAADELENRRQIEQQRLAIAGEAIEAQLRVQQAEVEQRRAQARLRRSQVEALRVRAGLDGVLQVVPVEVGQRVGPGTNLARVARPDRLKAVVRVPETQARDVVPGQKAVVDTRNGEVEARVMRVDPAVQNGTVTVDLALLGELPKGARPDLTVDGTIELERLENALHVGRPAMGQPQSTVGLFRLVKGTSEAVRVRVRLGQASVSTIEIVDGLEVGDEVILSDTSAWDAADRIRLN
ncbi:MAG TPA: HlyD family efflux transporter periplasmic adaptor subunit [Vicinamibacteria bacterium]|nr:HlyD family efflux transporter periplasmic adaptor subunit [Vicinamibacteria bacterium]